MLKKIGFAAAITFFVASFPAYPLGLGELRVHSALSQPLDADIPLIGISDGQLDGLKVSIPPATAFESAGLRRLPLVDRIQVKLVPNHGRPYIHLSTKKGVRQPFLDLLLRVESAQGATTREFTAFLNPPGFAEAPAVAAREAPASPPSHTVARAGQAPVRAAPRPVSSPSAPPVAEGDSAAGLPATYGPVQHDQTLWSIARSFRPGDHGVTIDQMVIGIYSHNPTAFGGSINDLLAGSVLHIPRVPVVAAIDPAQARSTVKRQVAAFSERQQSNEPPPATSGGHLELSAASLPEHAGVQAQADMSAAPAPDSQNASNVGVASGGGMSKPAIIPDAALVALIAEAKASPGNPFQVMPMPALPPPPAHAVDEATAASTASMSATQPIATSGAASVATNKVEQGEMSAGSSAAAKPAGQTASTQAQSAQPATAPPATDTTVEKAATGPADTPASAATETTWWSEADKLAGGAWSQITDVLPLRPTALLLICVALLALLLIRSRRRTAAAKDEAADIGAPAPALIPESAADTEVTEVTPKDEVDAALSDADFDIVFGRHDKALAALQPLIQAYPQRADLRLKELEVLHEAGRAEQFAERAHDLRQQVDVSVDDWDAVAAAGADLCPTNPLFADVDATGPVEERTQVRFAPAEQEAYAEIADGAEMESPEGERQAYREKTAEPHLSVPRLELGAEAEAGSAPAPMHDEGDGFAVAPVSADHAGGGEEPEADISTLEFEPTEIPRTASVRADEKPAVDESAHMDSVEFALDEQIPLEPKAGMQRAEGATAEAESPNDELALEHAEHVNARGDEAVTRLDSAWDGNFGDASPLDPNSDWGAMPEIEDDVGTKLDLARAYLDMEDREVALGLIDEVIRQGNAVQRKEAETLKNKV